MQWKGPNTVTVAIISQEAPGDQQEYAKRIHRDMFVTCSRGIRGEELNRPKSVTVQVVLANKHVNMTAQRLSRKSTLSAPQQIDSGRISRDPICPKSNRKEGESYCRHAE